MYTRRRGSKEKERCIYIERESLTIRLADLVVTEDRASAALAVTHSPLRCGTLRARGSGGGSPTYSPLSLAPVPAPAPSTGGYTLARARTDTRWGGIERTPLRGVACVDCVCMCVRMDPPGVCRRFSCVGVVMRWRSGGFSVEMREVYLYLRP